MGNQEVATRGPALSHEDRQGIDAFWQFFVPARTAITAGLHRLTSAAPWSSLYASHTSTERAREDDRVYQLQAGAIERDAWAPYLDDLRARGMHFARAGVELGTWFELVLVYRGVVRDELARRPGETIADLRRTDAIVRGMNRMLFLAIEAITEGYLASREQLGISVALSQEAHLRQTQRLDAIGRLAGGVAHDFNNALAVIGVYAAFLEDELGPSDRRQSDAIEIRRAGERAGVLTRQLLTLGHQGPVSPVVLDVDARIAAFEPVLQRLLGERVSLVIQRGAVASVLADADQLEQALVNLVVNAREAIANTGRVTIELGEIAIDDEGKIAHGFGPGHYVVIAVSDTGAGITAEVQRRMFEPFFTTKSATQGAGLGLAIVHAIVTQAGGHVSVYSELGHGTTVRVYLPVTRAAIATAPIEPAAPVPTPATVLQPVTVLVVDDQPELRAAVVRILAAAGCTTLEAETAEAARRLCVSHEHVIDVVLFDVILSDGRSDRVVAQLRELRPAMAVVLMSGFPGGALDAGGTPLDLLAKPFTPTELRGAIARATKQIARDSGLSLASSTVGKPARVLVVDDDDHVRNAVVRSLRGDDVEIVDVASGAAAIAAIQKQPFDVIVSDVMMPNMTGLEMLRAVRRIDLDVPVILMTGAPTVEAAAEAIEQGVFRYLTKPFDAGVLPKAVRHAARAHALARLRREAFLVGGIHAGAVDRAGLDVRYEEAFAGLYMAFQPIVEARSGIPFGVEALMRTVEPSLPNPMAMLDAATQLGRLTQLGRKIRALSAAAMAPRHDDLALFVNLHPDDLFDAELIDETGPLAQMAHRVVLEVTERAALALSPELTARLSRLRAMGFRVAIDDIGSGYSGLTSFTELDPEIVKLDMAIVRDVHRSKLKQRTIRALCRLCHEGGCLVVGEGVEVEAERACLAELGCDLLQGYLIARPHRELHL